MGGETASLHGQEWAGLGWALFWGKGRDHTIVIDRELEETMEVFIHLITTNETPTVGQALWQVPGIHLRARQGRSLLSWSLQWGDSVFWGDR